jgi:hypothetical protein
MQLRKIPLMELLEILNELYEDGVDYVDISGTSSNDLEYPQDLIKITVRPDYISQDDTEDIDKSSISVSKLSDNDINDLI